MLREIKKGNDSIFLPVNMNGMSGINAKHRHSPKINERILFQNQFLAGSIHMFWMYPDDIIPICTYVFYFLKSILKAAVLCFLWLQSLISDNIFKWIRLLP